MSKEYNPYMHTAEHILNRTMVNLFNCGRSYSSHLNADKSKCDYYFPRPLTDAEAAEVERRVNETLAQDLPVVTRVLPWDEAEALVDLSRLPASVDREQPVRLGFVGEYDVCPCIGEHVGHTGEVGLFRLVSHDFTPPTEEKEMGRLRVRFKLKRNVAGGFSLSH